LKLDNILPGWVKVPGKSGKATFSVVKKEQSTLFQDIVVDGGAFRSRLGGSRSERRSLERELPDLFASTATRPL